MNDEIKLSKNEIIGICEFLKIHHFENSYLLLDYITNLQKEKEEWKDECKKCKLRKDAAIDYLNYVRYKRPTVSDYTKDIHNNLLNILNGGNE